MARAESGWNAKAASKGKQGASSSREEAGNGDHPSLTPLPDHNDRRPQLPPPPKQGVQPTPVDPGRIPDTLRRWNKEASLWRPEWARRMAGLADRAGDRELISALISGGVCTPPHLRLHAGLPSQMQVGGSHRWRPASFRPRGFGPGSAGVSGGNAATTAPVSPSSSAGLGWLPDAPDHRDYGVGEFRDTLMKSALARKAIAAPHLFGDRKPPAAFDLRATKWLSPIVHQGDIGSCTAQAVVGMCEFMMRRSEGFHEELSRLFVYKVTRRELGWTGDTGAFIRSTIKVVHAFGAPPERYWPYVPANYELEPDAFLYAYGANFRATKYARLDTGEVGGDKVLDRIRQAIADGFVIAFGFPVYESIESPLNWLGEVPFPRGRDDRMVGGHAVLAVGYDDDLDVESPSKRGAIIFQNSWGTEWGDGGFGYLPYDYVRPLLACDFWVLHSLEWIDASKFE